MARRLISAHLFGLLVLVATLFALPQAARAHQGHVHEHAVQAHAAQAHTVHANAATAKPALQDFAKPRVEQKLTAAVQSPPATSHDMPCADLGCCLHSCCGACSSIVAPVPPLVLPPMQRAETTDIGNVSPSGINGPSLRRPPRFFA